MKAKHTPGNWTLELDSITTDADIGGSIVCDAPICFDRSMKYWEANAKLIAAAPDLLEALETYVLRMETMNNEIHLKSHGTYQKALKAIKKATIS